MKNNKGSITIEASLALAFFMFFILTFLSFGEYFKIQNAMKHSVNQAARTAYQDSEFKEMLSDLTGQDMISGIGDILDSVNTLWDNSVTSNISNSWDLWTHYSQKYSTWGEAVLQDEIKKFIIYYLTGESDVSQQDDALKKMNIYEMDLDGTALNGDMLEIHVSYKVHSRLSFWASDLTFTESLKIKVR